MIFLHFSGVQLFAGKMIPSSPEVPVFFRMFRIYLPASKSHHQDFRLHVWGSGIPIRSNKKNLYLLLLLGARWIQCYFSKTKHPWRLTAGTTSWRFGSDHFPWKKLVICRFQLLIFQGVNGMVVWVVWILVRPHDSTIFWESTSVTLVVS